MKYIFCFNIKLMLWSWNFNGIDGRFEVRNQLVQVYFCQFQQ